MLQSKISIRQFMLTKWSFLVHSTTRITPYILDSRIVADFTEWYRSRMAGYLKYSTGLFVSSYCVYLNTRLDNLENRSFRKRENLQYLKTAALV